MKNVLFIFLILLKALPSGAQTPALHPPNPQVATRISAALAGMEEAWRQKNGPAIAAFYADDAVMISQNGLEASGMEGVKQYWGEPLNAHDWKLEGIALSTRWEDIEAHPYWKSMPNMPPDWREFVAPQNGYVYQLGKSTLQSRTRTGDIRSSVVNFLLVWKKQGDQWRILVDTYASLTPPPAYASVLQNYIDSLQKSCDLPGVSLTLIRKNDAPVSLVSGWADIESQKPLRPWHRMLAGSTGKMFFASVALMQVEKGRLELDAPISRYLSGYAWFKRLPNASDITVRHLMSHRSGVEEYYMLGDFLKKISENPDKTWALEELVAYVLDRPAKFKAGEDFSYADTNYLLLGLVLQQILGQDLYGEVRNAILKPNWLRNTVPSDSRRIEGLITGYVAPGSPFGFSGATIQDGQFRINPQIEMMGGGFASNTENMARFLHALMKGNILSPALLNEMKSGLPANTGPKHLYGLGLQIRPTPYGMGYGHGGWFPGYLTEVEYFPDLDITIAVQFNTDAVQKLKGPPRWQLVRILELVK